LPDRSNVAVVEQLRSPIAASFTNPPSLAHLNYFSVDFDAAL